MARVSDHADNLEFVGVILVRAEPTAHGIRIAKQRPGKCLVNHGDLWRGSVVLRVERASPAERNFHGVEEILVDDQGEGRLFRRRTSVYLCIDFARAPGVTEQRRTGEANRSNSGESAQIRRQLVIEGFRLRVVVLVEGRFDREQDQTVAVESGIDVLEIEQGAEEQARTNKKCKWHDDLRHKQGGRETRTSARTTFRRAGRS